MKTIKLLLVAILLFTSLTNAQITKGNWMIGGDASFSYSKYESKNDASSPSSGSTLNVSQIGSYYILLEPNLGYFVYNKFCIGTKIYFAGGFSEGYKFEASNGNFSVGPYARYYFLKEEKQLNLFIEPSYYYFTNKSLGNATGYGIKAGTVIFFNSSIGFETALSYVRRSNEQNNYKEFFLGFGLQIHLEKK